MFLNFSVKRLVYFLNGHKLYCKFFFRPFIHCSSLLRKKKMKRHGIAVCNVHSNSVCILISFLSTVFYKCYMKIWTITSQLKKVTHGVQRLRSYRNALIFTHCKKHKFNKRHALTLGALELSSFQRQQRNTGVMPPTHYWLVARHSWRLNCVAY